MTESNGPLFDEEFYTNLEALMLWRRDVRRFRVEPVDRKVVKAALDLAILGPSVGNSQPWRFVFVNDADRRRSIVGNFEAANAEALAAYEGEDALLYASLKLSGLKEAPVQVSVFVDPGSSVGKGLGSKTMPESKAYSAVAAIQSFWLLLRARGIGMGWVSILDPSKMNATLDVDPAWNFIGHLCIGYPLEESLEPDLVRRNWQQRVPRGDVILNR